MTKKKRRWWVALVIVLGCFIFLGIVIKVGLNVYGKKNSFAYIADDAVSSYFLPDSNKKTRELKKMIGGTALGVCHPRDDSYNLSLLSDANIGWVRFDISAAPYEVKEDGTPKLDGNGKVQETDSYKSFKERCQIYQNKGIKVMALTPYPDDMLKLVGEIDFFNNGGDSFSENFINMVTNFSIYYATDMTETHHLVDAFQISNELTVEKWQGALSLDQVGEYLDLQMKAMHEITYNNNVPIGYNIAGYNLYDFPKMMKQYEDDYDYVALDLYLGCFENVYKTTIIYDLLLRYLFNFTKKPVFLNEFGYISAGTQLSSSEKSNYLKDTFGEEFSSEEKIRNNIEAFLNKWDSLTGEESPLTREARRKISSAATHEEGLKDAGDYIFQDDQIAHLYKSLPDGYQLDKYEHTEEGQASFFRDTVARLSKLDFLCGMFVYCYSDSKTCYQCGQEGCPVETGWGLVSIKDGTSSEMMNETTVYKKASYYAIQEVYGEIHKKDLKKYGK